MSLPIYQILIYFENESISGTGEKFSEISLGSPRPSALLVIFLSCPQIGSLSSSTANQRAAENNYRALGHQDLYFLNFVTCTIVSKIVLTYSEFKLF